MQASDAWHSVRVSNGRSASVGAASSPPDGKAKASRTGASGGGVGRGSSKAASATGVAAAGAVALSTTGVSEAGAPALSTTGVSATGASALAMAGSAETGSDVTTSPAERIGVAKGVSNSRVSTPKEMMLPVESGSLTAVAAFSTASELKPKRAGSQATRATAPHITAMVASCRDPMLQRLFSMRDRRAPQTGP
jgi:hypothetical protein